jgi:hypothetical protein
LLKPIFKEINFIKKNLFYPTGMKFTWDKTDIIAIIRPQMQIFEKNFSGYQTGTIG